MISVVPNLGTRLRQSAGRAFVASTVAVATPVWAQPAETPEAVVAIDTLDVRDTVYHLAHGGGNGLAFIDELNGGIVLIDTKREGWGQAITNALELITDLPITTIINSHGHADHTGSNDEFGDDVQIIAHENARNTGATQTFTDRYSLLEGFDRIELYYFGPAHTDGDIIVVFPEKGTAYVGDLFPSRSVPVIDLDHGGSGVAYPETLAKAVAAIEGVNRIVTGHGPFPSTYAGRGRRDDRELFSWSNWMNWDDLRDYADFTGALLGAARAAFDAGQSVDQAVASLELPDRFAEYDMEGAHAFVEAIYAELRNP